VTRAILLGIFAVALVVGLASANGGSVEGCAFPSAPTTYEGPRNRYPYLLGEELAGFNKLFPSDMFFGTPNMETGLRGERRLANAPYIPPTLLKSIGWIESALAQAANSVPWSAVGPALVSFDCGHGIMQITSGMTNPADSGWPSKQQALVATHYLYNIGRGAAILADKWNAAPEFRPIAGTDTAASPNIVENWYFAVWGYNGFTGPGANRSNHPMDPIYASWPRTGFSCGPTNDGYGHSYGNYPYQEIVFGCMARPPSVDNRQLWQPLAASLPNLNDSLWSGPLALSNFTTSNWYASMDIPSPQPTHNDLTDEPADGTAEFLLATPDLQVSSTSVPIGTTTQVTLSNSGSGILSWRAKPGKSWVSVNKRGGIALGSDVSCASGAPCERTATLSISTNQSAGAGWVDVESLTTGEVIRIYIVTARYDANCDGASNAIDGLLILQFAAGVIGAVPCPDGADANDDGVINVLDAAIVLQFDAGLID
jgi:hypothetical protein